MYYETMEQVLQRVDKTIIEAPGVTPICRCRRSGEAAAGAGPMIDFVRSRPIMAGLIALFLLFLVLGSFPIVPETKQASSSASASRCGSSTATSRPAVRRAGAGIAWRIPFAENIVWIDKRVLDVDMERQQVLSTDQLRLEVDAFARYRIVDPLRMYIRARSEDRVESSSSADPWL